MENSGLQIYDRICVWVTYEFVIVCIPPNINAVPATSQLHVLQIERSLLFINSSINNRHTLLWVGVGGEGWVSLVPGPFLEVDGWVCQGGGFSLPPHRHGIQWDTVGKQALRILLECCLIAERVPFASATTCRKIFLAYRLWKRYTCCSILKPFFVIITVRKRSIEKVMFSQACVKNCPPPGRYASYRNAFLFNAAR